MSDEELHSLVYSRVPGDTQLRNAVARAVVRDLTAMRMDAARFRFLQNLPIVKAQAYFWNWSSRKQRAQAIDEDMNKSQESQ